MNSRVYSFNLLAEGWWSEHIGVLDSKGHIVRSMMREGGMQGKSESMLHALLHCLGKGVREAGNSRGVFVVHGAIVVVVGLHDWDASKLRNQY